MAEDPIDVVRRFCESWSTLDVDTIMAGLTDDAVWHNIPMDPVTGADAIRGAVAPLLGGSSRIEFRMDHIAAAGDVVLTERVDIFDMQGRTVELPVMGTFEVRDGKVARWRDYFDMAMFMKMVQG